MTSNGHRGSDLALCFTVSVLLLFVLCTTVFMALQSRQTVAQSRRMDELEKLTERLHKRVVTLESLLAAKNSPESYQGKENKPVTSEKSERLNKVRFRQKS
jgi:low affinity Fe/Cu permease